MWISYPFIFQDICWLSCILCGIYVKFLVEAVKHAWVLSASAQ